MQWNELPTHFTAPKYAFSDDMIANDYLVMLDGLVYVPAVSVSENHVTPLTTEELTTSSVLDASAECKYFSNDYGECEDYEHNGEKLVSASDMSRKRQLVRAKFHQAEAHVHSMMAKGGHETT